MKVSAATDSGPGAILGRLPLGRSFEQVLDIGTLIQS